MNNAKPNIHTQLYFLPFELQKKERKHIRRAIRDISTARFIDTKKKKKNKMMQIYCKRQQHQQTTKIILIPTKPKLYRNA